MQSYVFSIKRLLKDSAGYSAFDAFIAFLRLVFIYVYTRALTPGDFGLLGIVYITISLLGILITSGLPSAAMIRFRVNDPEGKRELQNTSFLFIICANLVLIFCSLLILGLLNIPVEVRKAVPWALLCIAGDSLMKVPEISIRYKRRVSVYGTGKVIHMVVMISLLLYLYIEGDLEVWGVVAAEAVGSFFSMVFYYIFDRYLPALNCIKDPGELFRIGLPLLGISAVVFLIDFSDRYLVYAFLGESANGYYTAAGKIATVSALIVKSFNMSWDPYYYRTCSKTGIESSWFHFSGIRVVLLFSGLLSLLMIVLPYSINLEILGKSFIDPAYKAIDVLVAPLILAGIFKIILSLYSSVLEFKQKTLQVLGIFCAGVVINIIGNIFFTVCLEEVGLFFRLKGVALMTSASYMVSGILAFFYAKRDYPEFILGACVTACIVLTILAVIPFLRVGLFYRVCLWGVACIFIFRFYFTKRNFYNKFNKQGQQVDYE